MPTSLHIPGPLLAALDRRARKLKLSRNRFIVRTLEREVARATQWPPGFFDELRRVTPGEAAVVDEMLRAIHRGRSSKKAPLL